jgi:hypothetical protein
MFNNRIFAGSVGFSKYWHRLRTLEGEDATQQAAARITRSPNFLASPGRKFH